MQKKEPPRVKKHTLKLDGWGGIFLACFIAIFFRWIVIEAYVIPSGSMLPSLLIHDHIFVTKFKYGVRLPFSKKWVVHFSSPKRGEVIVFRYPEDESLFYIKRIVGIPGDKIYYEDGNLYVNDQLVEKRPPHEKKSDFDWIKNNDSIAQGFNNERYTHWEESLGDNLYSVLLLNQSLRNSKSYKMQFGPYIVPEDSYFVMGDNRDNSKDSRLWGNEKRFVPRKNLIGKALFVWLSCEKTLPLFNLCDPRSLRWKRFFHSIH